MDLQTALRYMKINGWCLLEGIIPADKVDAVRNSVEAAVSAHQSATAPDGIGHVPGLVRFEQSFAPYLAHPRLLGLVEALLGEHVRISFTTAQINFPGNDRGGWHADWPFNQETAGHVPAPYPDVVMHVTTLWLLSPFNEENGGTFIVPGSHRANNNPSGDNGIEPTQPFPTEMQVTGPAGSVLVFDSRLWHAIAPNRTQRPRTTIAVRYAPWWLNLDVLRPGTVERARMVDETGKRENLQPPLSPQVYDTLPAAVQPLFRHAVER